MARSETGTKAGKSGPKPRGMTARSPTKEPQDVDRHVGSRVRMQRMLVGMSQEKLGEACGITFQQIQKYEEGMNRMGASRLHQIARIQVQVEFFL
jgi:ribosome-binding protein aMBF1 (putative translation factor)